MELRVSLVKCKERSFLVKRSLKRLLFNFIVFKHAKRSKLPAFKQVWGGDLKKKFSELIFEQELFNPKYFYIEEGRLLSFGDNVFRNRGTLGFVYCGIIKNIEPKLNASFVYIGRNKNGFLHWSDSLFSKTTGYFINKFLGRKVLVQVLKEEFGTKGCRLTNNITLPGKLLILTPFSKNYGISKKIKNSRERFFLKKALKSLSYVVATGIVIRTDTRFESVDTIIKDLNFLLNKWYFLKKKTDLSVGKVSLVNQNFKVLDGIVRGFVYKKFSRIVTFDTYLYSFFLNFFKKVSGFLTKSLSLMSYKKKSVYVKNMHCLYENKIRLPSGGNIIFEETEALTSVDVNTGSHKNSSFRENFPLKVNLEASKKIVDEVILKNISGLIIIDFVDMGSSAFDKKIFKILKKFFFLNNNLLKIKVLPMSKLGIMQLTRQRDVESRFKFYFQKCYYCRGTGITDSIKYVSNCLNDKIYFLIQQVLVNNVILKAVKVHLNTKLFYFLKKKYVNYFGFLKKKFGVTFLFKPDLNLHLNKFFIKYKV